MQCEGKDWNSVTRQYEQCQREGQEGLDPYALEIYDEEIEVVLCDEHYSESAADI